VTADDNGAFSFELPMYSVAILEVGAESAGYGNPKSRHGWQGFHHWSHQHQWGPPSGSPSRIKPRHSH
jgi:alpha-N-arabinofuranosidase